MVSVIFTHSAFCPLFRDCPRRGSFDWPNAKCMASHSVGELWPWEIWQKPQGPSLASVVSESCLELLSAKKGGHWKGRTDAGYPKCHRSAGFILSSLSMEVCPLSGSWLSCPSLHWPVRDRCGPCWAGNLHASKGEPVIREWASHLTFELLEVSAERRPSHIWIETGMLAPCICHQGKLHFRKTDPDHWRNALKCLNTFNTDLFPVNC